MADRPIFPQDPVESVAKINRRVNQLERRRFPNPPQNLDDLDDCQVSYGGTSSAPSAGHVLTWVAGATPFGGIWQPAPSVAGDQAVVEAVGTWTDDGIFDEGSDFTFSQSVFVNGHSKQLVIVTARVSGISDSLIMADVDTSGGPVDINIPTSWRLNAFDFSAGGDVYTQNASGGGGAQVAFWISDDTDDGDSHVITTVCEGASGATYEFDATVEVTIETVFSLVAV